jgi:hypothetical protein
VLFAGPQAAGPIPYGGGGWYPNPPTMNPASVPYGPYGATAMAGANLGYANASAAGMDMGYQFPSQGAEPAAGSGQKRAVAKRAGKVRLKQL